jgi:glycosyltransferase involved in cell wall biosynthesis
MSKNSSLELTPQILFLLDDVALGDSQRTLIEGAMLLDPARYPYRVLLPSYEGELANHLREKNVEFDALPIPRLKGPGFLTKLKFAFEMLGYFRKLFRYFRMYDFQVVHSDGVLGNMISIGLKLRFNTPLVWHFWSILPSGVSLAGFKAMAAMFSDKLVSSTMFVAHQLGRSLRWRSRMNVLYRGYETIPEKAQKVTAEKEAEPVVGIVLSSSACRETFERAMERVRREIPECRTIVLKRAGANIAPELIRQRVSIYVSADAEPRAFDSGIVEAMSVGLPVVGARSGSIPEFILHDNTGFLFVGGDADDLAQAILRLARDPELRGRLGRNGKSEFTSRFEIKRYRAALEKIYSEFITAA